MFSGCREFLNSGVKIMTGCTAMPAPDSKVKICCIHSKIEICLFLKFCAQHKQEGTPCVLSECLSSESRTRLRNYRTRSAASKEALQVSNVVSFLTKIILW